MQLNDKAWEKISKFWGSASHVTGSPNMPYCVFATNNEDGLPRVAPYSSLILGENRQGFYFDDFSRQLTKNLDRDPRICVLLLKNNKWFWIKALLLGKFDHAPGIRLFGKVGNRREASPQEIENFKKPLKKLKRFKGYHPLWGIMKQGRDIYFDSFETVKCGPVIYNQTI